MFALVNLARHVDADPELALRGDQREVRAAFCLYRAGAGGDRAGPLEEASLEEMDALWNGRGAEEFGYAGEEQSAR